MAKTSEPMRTLEQQKNFKKKLVRARQEINNPKRSGKNQHRNAYVTLQDLYDEVLPPLLNEGLILTNYKDYINDKLVLITKIEDSESDVFISTFGLLNEKIDIQKHGAELTYHSRYNLGNLLSIRTDFDDDGESIKGISMPEKKELITEKQLVLLKDLISKSHPNTEARLLCTKEVSSLKELTKEQAKNAINVLIKRSEVSNEN